MAIASRMLGVVAAGGSILRGENAAGWKVSRPRWTPAFLHPEDTETVEAPAPWAALLPALDPTTMGWKARRFYLGDHAERIFDRNGNGGPTAWWNGRIVGGWTQEDDGTVVVIPVDSPPRGARGPLEEQARQLTDWLEGDVVRSIYRSPLGRARTAG